MTYLAWFVMEKIGLMEEEVGPGVVLVLALISDLYVILTAHNALISCLCE